MPIQDDNTLTNKNSLNKTVALLNYITKLTTTQNSEENVWALQGDDFTF